MERDEFKEHLLVIMERKIHWAWPSFSDGTVKRSLLHIHLEQEYATYIRDFPVLIGRAYVQCPIAEVRRQLAANLYEEETGGLIAGRPHPELFLEYPRGLGMALERFKTVELLPSSRRYRTFLEEASGSRGWEIGAAVTTLFVEGTQWERGEIDSRSPKRPEPPLDQHPLVKHYGLKESSLALTKAHRKVEGEHRAAAWRIVLEHVPRETRSAVVASMEEALVVWLQYRDGVAEACGLRRS